MVAVRISIYRSTLESKIDVAPRINIALPFENILFRVEYKLFMLKSATLEFRQNYKLLATHIN